MYYERIGKTTISSAGLNCTLLIRYLPTYIILYSDDNNNYCKKKTTCFSMKIE